MGSRGEGYVAIQFVLFAGIVFAPRLWDLPVPIWVDMLGWTLAMVGFLFALWGARALGSNLTPLPAPVEDSRLRTTGPYAIVRHPIYTAILIGSIGYSLVAGSPLSAVLTLALGMLFDRKTRREEAWLIEKHPEYAAYQRRVHKLIPGVY